MFLFSATAAAVIGRPLAKHKKDKKISSWIVEIEPQFKADWNSVGNDDDLIARYVEKAKEGGYENDIRKC
ncbi:hypothetical protein GQ600_12188 [Phytophthora cactorum]|nr:hypothetical protein GQ600_12188 [Phytophthora cactorum]